MPLTEYCPQPLLIEGSEPLSWIGITCAHLRSLALYRSALVSDLQRTLGNIGLAFLTSSSHFVKILPDEGARLESMLSARRVVSYTNKTVFKGSSRVLRNFRRPCEAKEAHETESGMKQGFIKFLSRGVGE